MTDQTPALSDPIPLEEPIQRGDTTIDSLQLRKPKSGELRGLKMADLVQLDVDTLMKLLPRVTVPPIVQHEAEGLGLADLMSLSTEVASFLLPKGAMDSLTT